MTEHSLAGLQRKVSIQRLRELARRLPKDHPFRIVMEVEDTSMTVLEFVGKVKTWLRLIR